MNKEEIKKYLQDVNAILDGHFLLASGKHSGNYIQCAKLFEYPQISEKIVNELANYWRDKKIDVVIGPAMGAVILSYELARALNVRSIFSERKDGKMIIKRNFTINSGENVLVVEDVVTTGSSAKELINILKEKDVNIIGVSSIINRSKTNPFAPLEYYGLIEFDFPTWEKSECPLCKQNIPLTIHGTKMSQKNEKGGI